MIEDIKKIPSQGDVCTCPRCLHLTIMEFTQPGKLRLLQAQSAKPVISSPCFELAAMNVPVETPGSVVQPISSNVNMRDQKQPCMEQSNNVAEPIWGDVQINGITYSPSWETMDKPVDGGWVQMKKRQQMELESRLVVKAHFYEEHLPPADDRILAKRS